MPDISTNWANSLSVSPLVCWRRRVPRPPIDHPKYPVHRSVPDACPPGRLVYVAKRTNIAEKFMSLAPDFPPRPRQGVARRIRNPHPNVLHPDAAVCPVRVVTYAWGEAYVDTLLSITLPAVLAPGNLPY